MRARLLVLCLAAGCGGDDSGLDGDVEGFPYFINFHVWQYEDGEADLSACLYRYRLCEEAGSVEVEHGDQRVELTRDPESGFTDYVGRLSSTRLGEPILFTWSGEGEQDRVTGEVGLAEPYNITEPSDGAILSSQEDVTIRWTAGDTDGLVAWGYRAECFSTLYEDFSRLVPDSGSIEIPTRDTPIVEGCNAELWIERLQRGATSSRLADIMSSRARYVNVSFGP